MDPSEPNVDEKEDVQDQQNTEAVGTVIADDTENDSNTQTVQDGEGTKDAETADSNGDKIEDADKKRSLEEGGTSEEPDATRPRVAQQNDGAVSEEGKKPEAQQAAAATGDPNAVANRMPPAVAPGVQMQPYPPFGGFPGGPENAAMQQHFFQQQFFMGQHPFVPGQGQMPMGMGGQFPMPQFMPPDQQQQQRFFQVPGQPQQRPAQGGAPGAPQVAQQEGVPEQGATPLPITEGQGVVNPPTENGAAPVQMQQMQGAPPPGAPPGTMPQQPPGAPPGQGTPEAPLQPGQQPINQQGGPSGMQPPPGMQPPGAQPGEQQAPFHAPFGQFVGGRPPFVPGGMGGFMPPDPAFQQMMLHRGFPPEADAAFRQRMMAFGGMPPGGAGQFRLSTLAAAGSRINPYSAELRGLNNLQPQSPATSLALACDDEHLSEYQILVRKQLEVFEALPEDVESNTQGRKKQVSLGQVGMRCRHCAGLPLRQRGRGAVYYPAKLQGVYQAAQNMASSHLCEACQCIDDSLKEELKVLRERRDTASGGKQYWADGARALGLFEAEDGLRLTPVENNNNNNQQQEQAQQAPPQPQPPQQQQQQVQPQQPPQPDQQT